LANWGVGSNDELRGWFLEDDVQDAILFFDFNRGLVFGCDQALFQVFYGHIGLATEIEFVEHGDIIGGGCCWCRWPWTHSLPRMVLSASALCCFGLASAVGDAAFDGCSFLVVVPGNDHEERYRAIGGEVAAVKVEGVFEGFAAAG